MPELPEVETLRRELNRALKNKKIKSASVLWPKTVAPLGVDFFEQQIKNKTIRKIERRAKILIINFTDITALAFHLKMTGQLIFVPGKFTTICSYEQIVVNKKSNIIVGGHPAPEDEKILPNKHTRLILNFSDGSILYFNDLRKFGWARLIDDSQFKDITKKIGVEPLSKLFTDEFLIDLFKKYPNRTMKQILMDQTLIAGIGNIYADESAFLTKVLPNRKVNTIKLVQIKKLRQSIIDILKLSIKMKGTSSRNYRRSDGSLGGFVPYLYVYGRAGQPCKICKTPIKKIRHVGRGTHYCPRCQK